MTAEDATSLESDELQRNPDESDEDYALRRSLFESREQACAGTPSMLVFNPEAIARGTPDLLQAAKNGPVVITDRARPTLVLMSVQEYDRLRGRRRLVGSSAELPDQVTDEVEGLAGPKP
jgi:prevent-host-death family protein